MPKSKEPKIHILLDNIRSTHNVGSIFRTAETAGVLKIYCVGTTPVPVDRFGRKRTDIAKVSLGAEDLLEWELVLDGVELVKNLKEEGFKIISVEQDKKSVDYKKVKVKGDILIIFGNEVGGVSKELLKLSDSIIEIPMKGKKESLNVSVSAGVVLFRLLDK